MGAIIHSEGIVVVHVITRAQLYIVSFDMSLNLSKISVHAGSELQVALK